MKARKIMALSLTAAMTLSMAACGDNSAQTNGGDTAGAGTEVTSEQGGATEAQNRHQMPAQPTKVQQTQVRLVSTLKMGCTDLSELTKL